ncbi:aminotransferase class III-fold pyridoxal phosphate-dependent enzyme [Paenibacillus amylolyticus]|uniref:aminotransferase class III-fold pyridoxal phosphate-dependent enzyme n=1 Tax=Paenibacillus amylolyticus TaxID=1451 RepID=UPI003D2BC2C0
MEYKLQFCGPTETNAVEAALKLARKYTGRTGVFSFMGAAYIEYILEDTHSGIEKPAAIILETVQAEGGIYVAESSWFKKIRAICD